MYRVVPNSGAVHGSVGGKRKRIRAGDAGQSRMMRTVEASAALMAIVVGSFWLALLSTPKVTEAGQPEISKEVLRP